MTVSLGTITARIYAILSGDAQLTVLTGGRIYNDVPQETKFPFIALGGNSALFLGTFDASGRSIIYEISIYGKSREIQKIYDIEKRIIELLDRQDEAVEQNDCIPFFVQYNGTEENPFFDMEQQGRELRVRFEIKHF